MQMLKSLGISKWSAALAFVTGGWAGLAELVCEAVTKLLAKADAEKLKEYAELAAKVANFLRYGIEMFVTKEDIKAAAVETATAVENLAKHLEDGVYAADELNADIDAIKRCIAAWKAVAK